MGLRHPEVNGRHLRFKEKLRKSLVCSSRLCSLREWCIGRTICFIALCRFFARHVQTLCASELVGTPRICVGFFRTRHTHTYSLSLSLSHTCTHTYTHRNTTHLLPFPAVSGGVDIQLRVLQGGRRVYPNTPRAVAIFASSSEAIRQYSSIH